MVGEKNKDIVVLDESQKSICRETEWKNTQKQVAEPRTEMQMLENLFEL